MKTNRRMSNLKNGFCSKLSQNLMSCANKLPHKTNNFRNKLTDSTSRKMLLIVKLSKSNNREKWTTKTRKRLVSSKLTKKESAMNWSS